MEITPLIEHLKALVPAFANNIAGCVDFNRILEDEPRLILPSLYIQLADEVGQPVYPEKQTYYQLTEQTIYAFVCLDNTADPRGQAAQNKVNDFRTFLNRALVGYQYIPQQHPFEFVRSAPYFMDRARYIHRFEYKLIQLIDNSDGYTPEYPDLNNIFADWNLTNTNELDHPDAQSQNINLNSSEET